MRLQHRGESEQSDHGKAGFGDHARLGIENLLSIAGRTDDGARTAAERAGAESPGQLIGRLHTRRSLGYDRGMKMRALLLLCGAALPAQNLTVGATGTLMLSWKGSGPVQTLSQSVNNDTTLQNGQVGDVSIQTGTTTTLSLSAQSPPWPGPTMGWWSQAAADVVVRYSAPVATAGVLRLNLVPACIMVAPPSIDVGDDGLYEIPPTGLPTTVDVPVVLGPRPISIRIVDTVVNFGAQCLSTASITFLPQPTNLLTTGIACGSSLAASVLAPSLQPGRLTLHVDDLPTPTNVLAAIAFGGVQTPMGSSCNPGLIADGWLFVTPTAGGFDLPIPLGAGLTGAVELQYVGLQLPFQLQWSNRVSLTLP